MGVNVVIFQLIWADLIWKQNDQQQISINNELRFEISTSWYSIDHANV
jgi:hypothetical protein